MLEHSSTASIEIKLLWSVRELSRPRRNPALLFVNLSNEDAKRSNKTFAWIWLPKNCLQWVTRLCAVDVYLLSGSFVLSRKQHFLFHVAVMKESQVTTNKGQLSRREVSHEGRWWYFGFFKQNKLGHSILGRFIVDITESD